MHVISMKRLREFWQSGHRKAEQPLRDWYRIARRSVWRNIAEVRQVFGTADPVKVRSGSTMTVFNIAGNDYRLVARVEYNTGRVYIKSVMTHAEYTNGRWKELL